MSVDSIVLLKLVFGGIALTLAAASAILNVWAAALPRIAQETLNQQFAAKWEAVRTSQWRDLPARTILWLLHARETLLNRVRTAVVESEFLWFAVLLLIVPYWVLMFMYFGLGADVPNPGAVGMEFKAMFSTAAVAFVVQLVGLAMLAWLRPSSLNSERLDFLTHNLWFSPVALLMSMMALNLAAVMSLHWACVYLLLLAPAYAASSGMALFFVMGVVSPPSRTQTDSRALVNNAFFIGVLFAASVCLTVIALYFGSVAAPFASVPLNPQMIASNVLLDTATMLVVFHVLRQAVLPAKRLAIPAALVIAVIIGAVFACCSLWFGLTLTPQALSGREITRVLIGRAPSGSGWELGPYFWAMHTTFLPTLFYLGIVSVCCIAKAMLVGAGLFWRRGGEPGVNPVRLTSALVGVLGLPFMILYFVFGALA